MTEALFFRIINRPGLAVKRIVPAICTLCFFSAGAQESRALYDEMKDSIVSKFNEKDFKGIYRLTDTVFSNKISEMQLVNFLKGNENSGKIVQTSFQSMENGIAAYLLTCQLRDIILTLQVTPEKKISSFGLANVPVVLLDKAPAIKSNNHLQSPLDRAIDSVAKEYFRYAKASALTIGIIKNGKQQVYHYGETDKNNGKLPDDQTLYEIGSITKTFTATILAQAILDGKAALTDDIRKYMQGAWPNLNYAGTPITLKDLADHSSRLPTLPGDIGDQPGYDPVNPESNYDSGMFYNALHHFSPDTLPGFKFTYSNWGISLLGHLLETIYATPHQSLVKKYVTGPLHMDRTGYNSEIKSHGIAIPHSENGNTVAVAAEGYFSPAGGIFSNAQDMLLYLQAQLNENNAAIKLTHQPTINSMGLAWGVRSINGQREFQHNGSTQGSTAHISVFPDIHNGCFILTNNKVNMGKMIIAIQGILKRP